MRIVVAGAGGFLGREIVRQSTESGEIDLLAASSNPQRLRDEFGVTAISARDLVENRTLLRPGDVLLNCAFPRNEDPLAMPLGLDYVEGVLRAASDSECSALINVSSQSVYSQRRLFPATEQDAVCLESKYAVAKYAVEKLSDALCEDIPHANLRLASLIGPGFDSRLPNKFVKKAMAGQDIEIENRGFRYGYMSVYDAASALLLMAKSNPCDWKLVYNLGSRGAASIPDMAFWANASAIRYGGIGCSVIVDEIYDENPINTELDCSMFEGQFAWVPRYTIEEEIDRITRFEVQS